MKIQVKRLIKNQEPIKINQRKKRTQALEWEHNPIWIDLKVPRSKKILNKNKWWKNYKKKLENSIPKNKTKINNW
jgi:hypothetical protein